MFIDYVNIMFIDYELTGQFQCPNLDQTTNNTYQMAQHQTRQKDLEDQASQTNLCKNNLENYILQTVGTKLDNFSVLTLSKYRFSWT